MPSTVAAVPRDARYCRSVRYHAMPSTDAVYGATRRAAYNRSLQAYHLLRGQPGLSAAPFMLTLLPFMEAKLPFMPALLPFMGKTLLFMLVLPPFREVVPPLLLVLLRFVDPILLFTEALTCVGAVWARVPCDLAGLPRGDETASRTRVPLFPSRDTLLQPRFVPRTRLFMVAVRLFMDAMLPSMLVLVLAVRRPSVPLFCLSRDSPRLQSRVVPPTCVTVYALCNVRY